jgi:hypothetical protein
MEKPTNAEQALIAYFSALSLAGHPVYFGSLGREEEARRMAYRYLSNEVKQRLTMQAFKKSLTGTAAIRLLKVFPADYGDDTDPAYVPRYFVELEKLEEARTSQGQKSLFTYYSGFYTLTREDGTFRIKSWDMKPEDFISPLGGHQPWRYDPEARAQQHVWDKLFHFKGAVSGPATLLQRKTDFAVVRVGKEIGGHTVYLARLESGEWVPLYLTGGPASLPGPAPPERRARRGAIHRAQGDS